MIHNVKLYIVILLILLYIYLIICIRDQYNKPCYKNENFIGFLDFISSVNNVNIDTTSSKNENKNSPQSETTSKPKKRSIIKKYIYLSKVSYDTNVTKYIFTNKKNLAYLHILMNQYNKILIKDVSNNIIGKDISRIHNKVILNINLYDKNIVVEYFNRFKSIKIYVEDSDKIFYINKKEEYYTIYLYANYIGTVIYDNEKYRITVFEDYKEYLNLFGIGITLLLHN